jgi:hypothetical protein
MSTFPSAQSAHVNAHALGTHKGHTHEMKDVLAAGFESRGAIWHKTLTLRGAYWSEIWISSRTYVWLDDYLDRKDLSFRSCRICTLDILIDQA